MRNDCGLRIADCGLNSNNRCAPRAVWPLIRNPQSFLTIVIACLAPIAAMGAPAAPAEPFVEETFTAPSMTVDLAAAAGGIVKTVDADEGTPVKAGDLVITLDTAAEEINLRAAQLEAEDKSEEEASRLTMLQAQDEAKILKQLSSEGVEAQLLYHQKELAAEVAFFKLAVARKNRQRAAMDLQAARVALERKIIRSPVCGLVTRMPKDPGEAVQPLETVAQIAVTDTLYVVIHPPARMLGMFRVGQQLPIEILEPRPQTVTATVGVVNEVVEAASNTFRVRLVMKNADCCIRAGVKARVTIAGPESLKEPATPPPSAAVPAPVPVTLDPVVGAAAKDPPPPNNGVQRDKEKKPPAPEPRKGPVKPVG